MNLPNNAISTKDAARIVGIGELRMRMALREGKIKAVKIGKSWYIDRDSLKDYINRNGSQRSDELEINGEHAIRLSNFMKKRRIKGNPVQEGKVTAVKLNGSYYITDSEARRYDKRYKEYYGRRIISFESAMERLKCNNAQLSEWIANNYLETVEIDDLIFVFTDTVKRFEEQQEAGLDFLGIPPIYVQKG